MMFKTLKSKIFAISMAVLAVTTIVFMGYGYIFEIKTKPLILDYYSRHIEVLRDGINNDIIKIENNSKELALIGNLFYKIDKNADLTKDVIKKVFYNYPDSLGGGIWFEPYVIDKSQKRFCVYAYRNEEGNVVTDDSFNSEEYNYLNQGWYKEIISQIKEKNLDVAWSLPYYENQGSNTLMITAGSGIYDEKGNLIGISTVDWKMGAIEEQIKNLSFILEINPQSSFSSGRFIKNHFALFANLKDDYVIVTTDPYIDDKSVIGKSLSSIPWYKPSLINDVFFHYHKHDYVPYVKKFDNGMGLVMCIPRVEMFYALAHTLRVMCFVLVILNILIPLLLYLSLNRYVMKPINILTNIAKKISNGEDVEIKIKKPAEFAQLASTYDKMTKDIKTITLERAKINSELSIAKSIQASSLPAVFPPFPDRKEFDIFASMDPAKEVSGDFYDFFFINENKLMFLVADVSGKGVPAALFMMTAKTLINNISQFDYKPEELIKMINKKICNVNKEGLFITMLSGIVNTQTGEMSIINCGHNLPAIKRKNGDYEYLNLPSNIVLGVFEDAEFEIYETNLEEGDLLFTYTDGVTEATNENGEMFGDKNLLLELNSIKNEANISQIVANIKQKVVEYMGDVPQSDDITMLIFKYQKTSSDNERNFKTEADTKNYKPFYTWLHEICKEWNLGDELTNKIDMCSEEIFANVAFYAYPNPPGPIDISFKRNNEEIILTFIDGGVAYDPLKKPDPDITLPPEQRPVGGLGIFMVKEMVKDVKYERTDDKNILTLIF